MNIKAISISLCAAALLPVSMLAQTTLEVSPGTLTEALKTLPSDVTSLTLTGSVGMTDLIALQEAPTTLSEVNMAEVRIVDSRLEQPYYGATIFKANVLPAYALANVKLSKLELPQTITAIEDGALSGSEVTAVTIPATVTTIGDYAFSGMPKLAAVDGAAALTTLGKSAFTNCPELKSVDFSKSHLASLPEMTFAGSSKLATAEFPETLTTIGTRAFAGTAITTLSPVAATRYDDYAFAGMSSLQSIHLNSNASYGEGVLMSDGLLNDADGTPAIIPAFTFADCVLLSTAVPLNDATSIGESAFYGNGSESLIFGAGLTQIDAEAFADLNALKEIDVTKLKSNIPALNADGFGDLDRSEIKLVVQKDTAPAWKADSEWGQFNVVEDQSTSLVNVSDGSGIQFALSGQTLVVTSETPLLSVDVYTTDGAKVASVAPGTLRAHLRVDNASDATVIIVVAKTATASRTAKYVLQ